MSIINTLNPSLADVAKRLDPDGRIATIAELLAATNEVLEDMTLAEGNLPTGHKTTVRSGLPSVTWRQLNYGVQPSKSRTCQVTDTCGMLEAYAQVDKSLAQLNGNTAEFRLSEDMAFLEAMNQSLSTTLFYGNTSTDPEKFMGLAPRYDLTTADNGTNIISAGGTESVNTSIWLVVWGMNTCHAFYPKGSQGGLQHTDLGEETVADAAGGLYQAYRSHYKWDIGLTLRDWRYVVRIANIAVATLLPGFATGPDLCDLMVQAIEKIRNLGMGRPVFYCNQTIRSMLRRQVRKTSNVNLSLDDFEGRKVLTFDGIPVRRCDALVNTEATVS